MGFTFYYHESVSKKAPGGQDTGNVWKTQMVTCFSHLTFFLACFHVIFPWVEDYSHVSTYGFAHVKKCFPYNTDTQSEREYVEGANN